MLGSLSNFGENFGICFSTFSSFFSPFVEGVEGVEIREWRYVATSSSPSMVANASAFSDKAGVAGVEFCVEFCVEFSVRKVQYTHERSTVL